jgi:hypothetical protein
MPRCEICSRQQPSADVRKMPGRDAHRCKDKFDCELAETNREPYTVTMSITFPAKSMQEAWDIVGDLNLGHYPTTVEHVQNSAGLRAYMKDAPAYDPDAVREAIQRAVYEQ